MDLVSVAILAFIVVVGVIGMIVTKTPSLTARSSDAASEEALDLADGWDQSREAPHAWLMPIGILFIIGALISGFYALTMDVSAVGYSSTVNIDLVGYRTMLFVAAQVQWLLGWMLCCTRLIINAIARFS